LFTLTLSLVHNEPWLLTSSLAAIVLMAVVIFFSLSEGKNMMLDIPLFLAVCLLISAIPVTVDLGGEFVIIYALRTVSYLAVALLCLAVLFAYTGLRLDRVLTILCILSFSMAFAVFGMFAVRLMIMSELDNTLMDTYVHLYIECAIGMLIAIIASVIIYALMKKNDVFLVTDETLLRRD